MNHSDFTTSILIDQTPKEVFNAITNVRGWWSEGIEGNTVHLGDEFTFEVKDVHYSKQKLVEVIPDKKVVWLITESHMTFIEKNDEWTGTKVIFEIFEKGHKTQLVFTHEGLNPEVECYGACSPAWTEYIQHSLFNLIKTGQGDPNLEGKRIKAINHKDFTTSFEVDQSPAEVFTAINNPKAWWSESIKGGTEKVNDEYSYEVKDLHTCRIKVTEVEPDKKVVWHVLDNYFSFVKDEKEWIGTDIVFEISHRGDKTQVRFTHKGLTPAYECYDICDNAWTSYIQNSLKDFITTGKGQPGKY